MLNKKNKKGELTTTQLVTIIVLIASFAIILILLFRLNLGETTDSEICRNSVVLKGRTEGFAGTLDCKTQYICISGGSDCTNFSATEKVKVNSEERNETLEAIADAMTSCWYTFGEGKIDYGDLRKPAGHSICAVCSIVNFDSSLREKETISYMELYNYLKQTNKSNSQTYFQYLYSTDDTGFLSQNYLANNIEFDKPHFILTGIRREGIWNYVFSLDSDIDSESQPVIILENTAENYQQLGCDEFVTKA